jgi:hypothetical protein
MLYPAELRAQRWVEERVYEDGARAQRQVVGLNGSCDRRRAGEGSPLFTESGSTKAG